VVSGVGWSFVPKLPFIIDEEDNNLIYLLHDDAEDRTLYINTKSKIVSTNNLVSKQITVGYPDKSIGSVFVVKNESKNIGEDTYKDSGESYTYSEVLKNGGDTCNRDINSMYACRPNEEKYCADYYRISTNRYGMRYVTCRIPREIGIYTSSP